MSFKSGDVVRLKSGGPPMTVMRTNKKLAECVWFLKDHSVTSVAFSFHLLVDVRTGEAFPCEHED
jgi:uncharacterized protein YodC (DUF2158 family)